MGKAINPNPKSKGNAPSREAFKNYGSGQQNFENAKIKSESCSCVLRRNGSDKVVYYGGAGQKFKNGMINGVKVESETTSSSVTKTTNRKIYCTTCGAFINLGTGYQNFKDCDIRIGRN
ncbi:hypothetical protein DEO72_LG2g4234 [Vigna unguiculata]|uniref:Uncharacterized protein n=1 Tax=Vigna unguiculata TaxID=3917 RepID=A0A4D6L5Y6_VIGUN|nr:hypothetical protein DEO72_LG2g4234 [Vigna unguiculata]